MTDLHRLEQVLEETVRPQLRAHGGDIRSLGLENGIYRFQFLGRCSGCPSADLTTQEIVGAQIKEVLPEIKDVVLVQRTSEALLAQARSILGKRNG